MEGEEVKREGDFWIKRVVASLNVREQASAKPGGQRHTLDIFSLSYLRKCDADADIAADADDDAFLLEEVCC